MEDINEPFRPEVAPPPLPVPPPAQCVPSPLVISVEEDGKDVEDRDEVDPESVRFDNADVDKAEPADVLPEPAPAHGVGGAITPPSAEIRSSEPEIFHELILYSLSP